MNTKNEVYIKDIHDDVFILRSEEGTGKLSILMKEEEDSEFWIVCLDKKSLVVLVDRLKNFIEKDSLLLDIEKHVALKSIRDKNAPIFVREMLSCLPIEIFSNPSFVIEKDGVNYTLEKDFFYEM